IPPLWLFGVAVVALHSHILFGRFPQPHHRNDPMGMELFHLRSLRAVNHRRVLPWTACDDEGPGVEYSGKTRNSVPAASFLNAKSEATMVRTRKGRAIRHGWPFRTDQSPQLSFASQWGCSPLRSTWFSSSPRPAGLQTVQPARDRACRGRPDY